MIATMIRRRLQFVRLRWSKSLPVDCARVTTGWRDDSCARNRC